MPRKPRGKAIIFRLTEEQYREIIEAAKRQVLTVSQYARLKILPHELNGAPAKDGSH